MICNPFRKILIAYNVKDKTDEEIFEALRASTKIYLLLFCLNLLDVFGSYTDSDGNWRCFEFLIAISLSVLTFSLFCLFYASFGMKKTAIFNPPDSCILILTTLTLFTALATNIGCFVYYCVISFEYTILINIFSFAIQISTIRIMGEFNSRARGGDLTDALISVEDNYLEEAGASVVDKSPIHESEPNTVDSNR